MLLMSQETTADSPGSQSYSPRPRTCSAAAPGAQVTAQAAPALLRRVWFYCEVNCVNIVTNEKKCLLETDT